MTNLWQSILTDALAASRREPSLASYYYAHVLNHASFVRCLSFNLSESLASEVVPATLIRDVIDAALADDDSLVTAVIRDLNAVVERDAACDSFLIPLLYFKGFKALQSYRIAHYLWRNERRPLALFFQSVISERFHVDIHPNAQIGSGLLVDHATNIVIGESTVVGDDVSMLHSVTLGGSGTTKGCKRHPTVASGVLLASGAKILGPVNVGESAKIAAGSVVVEDVEPHATVAGVPAVVVRRGMKTSPALDMQQNL